jgi:hypothetical protein
MANGMWRSGDMVLVEIKNFKIWKIILCVWYIMGFCHSEVDRFTSLQISGRMQCQNVLFWTLKIQKLFEKINQICVANWFSIWPFVIFCHFRANYTLLKSRSLSNKHTQVSTMIFRDTVSVTQVKNIIQSQFMALKTMLQIRTTLLESILATQIWFIFSKSFWIFSVQNKTFWHCMRPEICNDVKRSTSEWQKPMIYHKHRMIFQIFQFLISTSTISPERHIPFAIFSHVSESVFHIFWFPQVPYPPITTFHLPLSFMIYFPKFDEWTHLTKFSSFILTSTHVTRAQKFEIQT